MMSVSEYANDVGMSVKEILNLCKKLEIPANDESYLLSDDDIIMLDNEIASYEEENESEEVEETESTDENA